MPKISLKPRSNKRSAFRARLLAGALMALLVPTAHASEPLDCLIEPYTLVDLSSSEVGVLGAVRVDEADPVRKGQIVAALDNDVERAVLELSRARADAVAEVALLRRDHEFNTRKRLRIDKLSAQRAVSAQSVDEVRTEEELARLRLRAAAEKQHAVQLEATRDALALERRIVRSPIDGVVVQRYKTVGEFVDGVPIVQLAQLDPLRIKVVAPISMFGKITVGMQANVLPELPLEGQFVASVTSIDPVMDAATATFGVRLSLPNPEHRLPAGLKCTLVLRPMSEHVAGTGESTDSPAERSTPPDARTPPIVPPTSTQALVQAAKPRSSEPPPVETPESSSQHASSSAPAATASGTPTELCASLGPLLNAEQADALAARLSTSTLQVAQRYEPVGTGDVSWVVLSRSVHRTPATIVKRIKQARITDWQYLTRGDWKHRISYGAYRGKASAQRRVDAINALGFAATLVQRGTGKSKIWLDLTPSTADPALSRSVSTVLDEHPDLSVQSVPCTQLASR